MTKPIIKLVNAATGEEIEREMTDNEFDEYKLNESLQLAHQVEQEAKAAARQVILDRLGLTEEEARLLLG